MIKTKYNELVKAIKNNEFPIVVFGPTATGKTYAITNALKMLKIKYKYVELSETTINKPLRKEYVIHTVLNKIQDLDNIKYDKNVIIETSIHGVNERLENSKLIKFSNKKVCDKKLFKYKKMDENNVDIFRFLGRIFYKKLNIKDLENDNKMIYYNNSNNDIKNDSNLDIKKENIKSDTSNNNRSNNSTNNFKNIKIDSKVDIKKVISGEKNTFSNRIFLLEESESSEGLKNIKDDSSSFYTLSDDIESENNNNISMSVERLKKILNTKEEERTEYNISFDINRIETFMYENLIHFVNFSDLPIVYDNLSLNGINKKFFLCFVQSILKRGTETKKGFYGFKVSEKVEKSDKTERNGWQYNFISKTNDCR